MAKRDTRRRILDGCLEVLGKRGCRFTISDLENDIQISRRTIYKYFTGKDEMLIALIDETTQEIREQQQEVLQNDSLSIEEKLYGVMTIEPRPEKMICYEDLYQMRQYYPRVYDHFYLRYEEGWEPTRHLIEQGIEEGIFKNYSAALINKFFQDEMLMLYSDDFLAKNHLAYREALTEIVEIVIQGIKINRGE